MTAQRQEELLYALGDPTAQTRALLELLEMTFKRPTFYGPHVTHMEIMRIEGQASVIAFLKLKMKL